MFSCEQIRCSVSKQSIDRRNRHVGALMPKRMANNDNDDEVKLLCALRPFRNWLQIANLFFLVHCDYTDYFQLKATGIILFFCFFFSSLISFSSLVLFWFFIHFPQNKKDKLRFRWRRMGRAARQMRHECGTRSIMWMNRQLY